MILQDSIPRFLRFKNVAKDILLAMQDAETHEHASDVLYMFFMFGLSYCSCRDSPSVL